MTWTDEQRKKIHAMLRDLSRQAVHPHTKERMSEEQWKAVTLEQWGVEVDYLPSLDNRRAVPVRWSFRDTLSSIPRASDYVEFLHYVGAHYGVQWSDPEFISQMKAMKEQEE